jgi:general secretion pathway protein K
LLLVPGIDYPLYARIAPLVSADLTAVTQVNPLAAPPEVLAVLAQGQGARVQQFLVQRASGQGADTSIFNGALLGDGGTDLYRLQARVPIEAGKILLLTRDVALGSIYSRTAPWRILRADRQIVSAGAA